MKASPLMTSTKNCGREDHNSPRCLSQDRYRLPDWHRYRRKCWKRERLLKTASPLQFRGRPWQFLPLFVSVRRTATKVSISRRRLFSTASHWQALLRGIVLARWQHPGDLCYPFQGTKNQAKFGSGQICRVKRRGCRRIAREHYERGLTANNAYAIISRAC